MFKKTLIFGVLVLSCISTKAMDTSSIEEEQIKNIQNANLLLDKIIETNNPDSHKHLAQYCLLLDLKLLKKQQKRLFDACKCAQIIAEEAPKYASNNSNYLNESEETLQKIQKRIELLKNAIEYKLKAHSIVTLGTLSLSNK